MNSFQLYLFLKKMSALLNGTISRAYENLIVSLRTNDCSDEEDQIEEENATNETNDELCCLFCKRMYSETKCRWLRCGKCQECLCFDCLIGYTIFPH